VGTQGSGDLANTGALGGGVYIDSGSTFASYYGYILNNNQYSVSATSGNDLYVAPAVSPTAISCQCTYTGSVFPTTVCGYAGSCTTAPTQAPTLVPTRAPTPATVCSVGRKYNATTRTCSDCPAGECYKIHSLLGI
jgi:hypothetical protein